MSTTTKDLLVLTVITKQNGRDFSIFTQYTLRCVKVFEKIQYFQIQIKIKNLLIICLDIFQICSEIKFLS